ncbi:MAG: DUF3052 domain-containing protein [Bacteroidota bacterium]|nr:DUF3052 domain-containing protein [Bacteroidota bacterium]
MTAVYSDTPLLKKLGIKETMKVLLINKPENYFELLGVDISDKFCKQKEVPDFIHLFVKTKFEYESEIKKIRKNIKPTTVIWVSWLKKSSKIATDVTEDAIRNYALQNDLVDVKVCAVSDIWSGLKLVVPLSKR